MTLRLHRIHVPLTEFALTLNVTISSRVTALCGRSGAGKTTLLDLIAGLRRPQSAFIQRNDDVLTDTAAGVHIPARRRRVGYVPQDLALFPHLSVRANLLYGHKRETAEEPTGAFGYAHVTEALEIKSLGERTIAGLSGGEKQRVALARALLSSPRLLLLDEPLASLDRALKLRILPYLIRIRDDFQIPMIYVTHDPDEVHSLCDQVVRLERGAVIP